MYSDPVFRKSDLIMNKAAETEATQVMNHSRLESQANIGGHKLDSVIWSGVGTH